MFAKLARFNAFNRTVGRRFGAAACNDNQPVRRFIASPRPLRRPILLCHWHKAASGALECSWHIGAIATMANVEEPDISRLGQPMRAHRRCLTAPFVTLEHIAVACRGG